MARRFGLALSLLAAISLLPLAAADAGDRHERRIHKQQKYNKVRLRDINAESRRYNNGRFTVSRLSAHDRDRRHHRRYRIRVNNSAIVVINAGHPTSSRLSSYRTGANTYIGTDVYSVPGVGTYSYGDYSGTVVTTTVPSAKIIDVSKLKANSACEMQAGVCVIKP